MAETRSRADRPRRSRRALLPLVLVLTVCGCQSLRQSQVAVVTGEDFTAYQAEAVTVWFSYWFQVGFIFPPEDVAEAETYYHTDVRELGPIFARGLVTGEDFYEAFGVEPPETPPREILNLSAGRHELPDLLASSEGPLVKILHVVRVETEDLTRREYDLWATFHRDETGWGAFEHFRLKLVNPAATASTSPAAFAQGAVVEEFDYAGTEI